MCKISILEPKIRTGHVVLKVHHSVLDLGMVRAYLTQLCALRLVSLGIESS